MRCFKVPGSVKRDWRGPTGAVPLGAARERELQFKVVGMAVCAAARSAGAVSTSFGRRSRRPPRASRASRRRMSRGTRLRITEADMRGTARPVGRDRPVVVERGRRGDVRGGAEAGVRGPLQLLDVQALHLPHHGARCGCGVCSDLCLIWRPWKRRITSRVFSQAEFGAGQRVRIADAQLQRVSGVSGDAVAVEEVLGADRAVDEDVVVEVQVVVRQARYVVPPALYGVELKTGSASAGRMSRWSTTVMPSASGSSQDGTWESVTR
ncbi:hypothetical protein SGLAM104S_01516 [Streptomyces glaucescens]